MAERLAPLVVIVGQTGSGKTALAIDLAKRFGGEIIAADSRTVYKGMDIGTAKPTAAELATVPHHLIDVVEPNQNFTAADFKQQALVAINDISNRGKLPIMVGGSGLYVDSVIYDYQFRPVADPLTRQRIAGLSVAEMQAEIVAKGLQMPSNSQNPRHLSRVLETGQIPARTHALRPHTLVMGIQLDRTELLSRISQRVDDMFAAGLVEEAKGLFEHYGTEAAAFQTPGYSALNHYLAGAITLDQTKQEFVASHMALAKRQRTWFGRNKSIQWLPQQGTIDKAVELITTELNKPTT